VTTVRRMGAKRFGWAAPRTATVVGAVAGIFVLAGIPLSIANHGIAANILSLVFLPFGIVGFVVARRQPRNPIGWILLAILVGVALADVAGQYALLDYDRGYHGLPLTRLAVFLAAGWIVMVVLLPLPIALFPDGTLPRRWRGVWWVYLANGAIFIAIFGAEDFAGVQARHIKVDSSGELAVFGGNQHGWEGAVTTVLLLVYVATSLLWVVRQAVGYRRSAGDRRQQLKWLISGGAICVIGFVVSLEFGQSQSKALALAANLSSAGIVALPVSIGIGILKYRLYDIDRLISRTLSYAVITGLLVGVYVGMIALTTRLIPLSSSVGVAASTLSAVALFTPVRRRVQHGVDRRFNRTKYNSEAMVSTFKARLRDAVQLETVRADLLDVVNGAVEPSTVSLWIRPMSRV
jgi:hypothetical protein